MTDAALATRPDDQTSPPNQATAARLAAPVFAIDHMSVTVQGKAGPVQLVSDVSLSVRQGECVGVVGESGCGKTVSVMSALGLMPKSASISGQVRLGDLDLLSASEQQLQSLRGRRIGMIFQDPQSALNPVRTIGEQMAEPMMLHLGLSKVEAHKRSIELLSMVGLPAPETRLGAYPNQLSGGMCQRVMIAIALGPEPKVLIADEPTTALDATVQLQVLDLLKSIQRRTGLAIVIITHDLGVVARICDRAHVLYAGRTVETRAVPDIFHAPWHRYTKALLDCLPRGGNHAPRPIVGEVPMAGRAPQGCAFHPRCGAADATCSSYNPAATGRGTAGHVACHHPLPESQGMRHFQ